MFPFGILNSMEEAVKAIQEGDLEALSRILAERPGLVHERVDGPRTLLHVATDWPGHFPNAAATVRLLLERGADVYAPFIGADSETPLHWAASSNDVAVMDVLLDHGANIEAQGGVLGGGTPMADAVAFAQWNAARRLLEHGASTNLWQAAALGLMNRLGEPTDPAEITKAFWCACHGGQRETAEYLLQRGADPNWIGYDKLTPLGAARRAGADKLVRWLSQMGAR